MSANNLSGLKLPLSPYNENRIRRITDGIQDGESVIVGKIYDIHQIIVVFTADESRTCRISEHLPFRQCTDTPCDTGTASGLSVYHRQSSVQCAQSIADRNRTVGYGNFICTFALNLHYNIGNDRTTRKRKNNRARGNNVPRQHSRVGIFHRLGFLMFDTNIMIYFLIYKILRINTFDIEHHISLLRQADFTIYRTANAPFSLKKTAGSLKLFHI